MKTVMQHNFAQIEGARIPRSAFDRTSGHKFTMDSDYLVPFFVDEILPGDTFKLRSTIFARMATPIFPIMDNLFLDVMYFAVPLRQVWDNFQKFMGEQIDPGDSIDYTIPQMVSPAVTGYAIESLEDYFELPTGIPDLTHSALWHRAYYHFYNTWIRDQNLQDSLTFSRGDGPDLASSYTLQKRGKRHDYFTSCLPWPQKGDAISLPLGDSAPVQGIGVRSSGEQASSTFSFRETDGTGTISEDGWVSEPTPAIGEAQVFIEEDPSNTTYPNIRADLTEATAITINALRLSEALQTLVERDARGGTRYIEIVKSHFGVTSPDARLQRPEFLGGATIPVNINPITQTSEAGTTPQGTLAAIGTAGGTAGFTKSFVEHSVVIGLCTVRADLTYQQGLHRMWSRLTRYDFYMPALAHLGEQAVLNQEIYAQDPATLGPGGTSANTEAFGYNERWSELRYKNSAISGKFRSTAATSLDPWHLSQEFGSLPVLDSDFITEDVPMARVEAIPTEPDFIVDTYNQLRCVRPLPIYSTPRLGVRL